MYDTRAPGLARLSHLCNPARPSCCAGDLDLDRILDKLQQLLECLVREQLTPEQASHVMRISLGKFVQYLLKIRLNEPSTERVNSWFHSVMHTTIELLRTHDAWEMVDCTSRILTDSPNYHFYQLGVCAAQLPSCDVDSQSSGSGSDYAARAGPKWKARGTGARGHGAPHRHRLKGVRGRGEESLRAQGALTKLAAKRCPRPSSARRPR